MKVRPQSLELEALEDRTLMSTCHVTRLTDVGAGMGFRGDLRYCINKVNAEPGADIIILHRTGTINLTEALPILASDIDIQGPGSDALTIRRDTGGNYRILDVAVGATVGISGVTLSNGYIFGSAPLTGGAGIRNQGTLLVSDSVIADGLHEAAGDAKGGGIFTLGNLTLIRTTIRDNYVQGSPGLGAGIQISGASPIVSIYDSTIANNGSELVFSDYSQGGGINVSSNNAVLSIVNSTIQGNEANDCGGIFVTGVAVISHSTIAENRTTDFYGALCSFQNRVFMRNTIVAGNTLADVYGTLAASDHNLIGNTNQGGGFGPTDILNVDPLLGPLQDNGGPTQTMALLPSSPAIDVGDNSDAPEFDQRGPGFPRIVNGTIDRGAFEVQATSAPNSLDFLAFLITADFDEIE